MNERTGQKLLVMDEEEGTAMVESLGGVGFTVQNIRTVVVAHGLQMTVGTVIGTPVALVSGNVWTHCEIA